LKPKTAIKSLLNRIQLKFNEKIAKYLRLGLGKVEISTFKDGEIYARIEENVRGKDVFVIQPTSKNVNHNLMELAIIMDALKRAAAKRITAVIPYYGYARQDRKAKPREPITAKLVADLIAAAGADRVLTMELHADQIQGFFNIPLDHLSSINILADYFASRGLKADDTVIVAPDAGAAKKARQLGKALKLNIAIIDKRREEANEVAEMNVIGEVKDKNCILLDDMIDTGGTICEAAKALKEEGAKKVFISATHAILSGPAKERLDKSAAEEVVLTDTIFQEPKDLPKKVKIVSVAALFGEAIELIHVEETDSSIDDIYKKQQNKLTDF
jgi:ribose-phosphate pyrophosphokinase